MSLPEHDQNAVGVFFSVHNAEKADVVNMDTAEQGRWSTVRFAVDRWNISADLTFRTVEQVEHIERLLAEAKAHLAEGGESL